MVRCPIRLVQVDLISRLRQSRMVERVGDFMDSGRRGGRALPVGQRGRMKI